RSYDEDYDVRHLCAARAHAGERFVARCIHEHHGLALHLYFVCADVLRDAARFTTGNVRFADGVEQTGFAVVHVAHDRNDGRTRPEVFLGLFLGDFQHHLFFEGDDADHTIEGLREVRGGLHIKSLVDAGEDAAIEQGLQQIFRANVELFREFADGDAFGQGNFARRAGFRGSNCGRGNTSAARTLALPGWMEFALALHLPLVHHGTLALRGLARIERFAGFRLDRHLFWKWRQHRRAAGSAWAGARTCWHGAGPLTKGTA